ncbi:universal stress protein [Brumimicrobium mesophilum]|uniref:universal stress protein n=1 Tax=Brumimicrobium mesophilum TaxID=392717 RepID=UPI000D1443C1|nr:universal stress protein [Brumimicrobium mesophilum]
MEKVNNIKVLIPTNFSVEAEYAYLMVNNLSNKANMEITFLHILNVPDTVTLDVNGMINTCGEIDMGFVSIQRDLALQKLAELEAKNPEVKTDLIFGHTTTGITQYAEDHNFDLIAMGTKGTSGFTERFIGSNAQLIARNSNVPVLSLMCDRSELELKDILLVHNFQENEPQKLDLVKSFIQIFDTKLHFLQIAKKNEDEENIKESMQLFAKKNQLHNYEMHIMYDHNIEVGINKFVETHNMDIVCIGTHGKGGIFHKSPTETLINHLYKPVISYKIK